jgi:NADH-quinone oxidoreductase subunit D
VKQIFLKVKYIIRVEGGNGELGFYLISDGGRTPYRLHFRRPCFIYYQAYPEMIKGKMLSDAILQ